MSANRWLLEAAVLICVSLTAGGLGLASEPESQPSAKPAKEKESHKPRKLFNGKDLAGWKVIDKFVFEKHGKVAVKNGEIILPKGNPGTGISYQKELPRIDYEISLDAKRTEGGDFFCGLTFPVEKSYCTLILGGWGGGVTGLSNVDGLAAIENESTDFVEFKKDQWYHVRLRVTQKGIDAWVDKEHIVNVPLTDRKFDIWWEQEPVRPLGIASWYTGAALRDIQFTSLKKAAAKSDK